MKKNIYIYIYTLDEIIRQLTQMENRKIYSFPLRCLFQFVVGRTFWHTVYNEYVFGSRGEFACARV